MTKRFDSWACFICCIPVGPSLRVARLRLRWSSRVRTLFPCLALLARVGVQALLAPSQSPTTPLGRQFFSARLSRALPFRDSVVTSAHPSPTLSLRLPLPDLFLSFCSGPVFLFRFNLSQSSCTHTSQGSRRKPCQGPDWSATPFLHCVSGATARSAGTHAPPFLPCNDDFDDAGHRLISRLCPATSEQPRHSHRKSSLFAVSALVVAHSSLTLKRHPLTRTLSRGKLCTLLRTSG